MTNKQILYYNYKTSDFGPVVVTHTQRGICAILYGTNQDEELKRLFPNESLQNIYSSTICFKIIDLLNSGQNLSDIPIDIRCGTPFQKLVWENLCKVPYGSTITYSGLANNIGMPRAVRALATAVGSNPISILIPCHRVVPKSGGIGKYRWGSAMKQELLNREQNL